ncbi:transglutaminase-like domain-containing protein [Oceanidesulfovibrio marinus]|uniref:Transglutaminase domain-containing protein n=1 Tax=Oceanidesulfovibrio marinus TaxID=370038 RepID=A0ABX6NKY5_9BACT|nr:transglutaminase-like domain-containing protein [Oceanidesulfovibrio marinus]QJT10688.1 transglutaminase domain-containing protein [Oceanidesulfovibrio marinus]
MKTPPLLIGLSLLLWGYATGMLWTGAALAAGFELRWLTRSRAVLELSDQAVTLFFDCCLLIAAGSALFLFLSPDDPPVGKTLLLWLPLVFAPLALAQAYSRRNRIPFSALARLPGRRRPDANTAPDSLRAGFDFLPVYAGMACVAAAGANPQRLLFYPAIAVLTALFLFANRPARGRPSLFFIILVLALSTGFVTQDGIERAQRWARAYAQRMIKGPFEVRTAIDEIGELKISRRIVLRVELPHGMRPPLYLATSAYNFFDGSNWTASNATFVPLEPVPETDEYVLSPGAQTAGDVPASEGSPSIRIFQDLVRGEGLLPLPPHTASIAGMGADVVETSGLGAVLVDDAPGFIAYNATMRAGAHRLGSPLPIDGLVTPANRDVLEPIVQRLGLRDLEPAEAARRVQQYFHTNFSYSVVLERNRPELTPLQEFLTVSRSGHCEYFATAATLLLRQAGIPARYTMGYAVWEPGPDPGIYLVRESHAHSWPRYWSGERWMDIDPTPPLWLPEDTEALSPLQWLWDWRADAAFAFMRWRYAAQNSAARGWLLAGAGLLAVFLIVRIARRGGLRRRRMAETRRSRRAAAFGADSPFYTSIAEVERRMSRRPGEPVLAWLARAGAMHLVPAARLHYRYRFDPRRDPDRDEALRSELETAAGEAGKGSPKNTPLQNRD